MALGVDFARPGNQLYQSGHSLQTELKILQLNVETSSLAKLGVLHHLATLHQADVLVLCELKLVRELQVDGFRVATHIKSKKYGFAILVRDNISDKECSNKG